MPLQVVERFLGREIGRRPVSAESPWIKDKTSNTDTGGWAKRIRTESQVPDLVTVTVQLITTFDDVRPDETIIDFEKDKINSKVARRYVKKRAFPQVWKTQRLEWIPDKL